MMPNARAIPAAVRRWIARLPAVPLHRRATLPRLAGTAVLALAAVLGNVFSVSLFFGVEIQFGSIAALVAVARLGLVPGVAVAMAGGAYTLVLWNHPYALVIFTLEAAAVGWHRRRQQRQGLAPPPLGVSAALYWLLLGIPLVILCYHGPLGMGWLPTLLIAAKQSVNGILNAALAGSLLVAIAMLGGQRGLPRLQELLFSLLLSALLLPAVLITAWENKGLKDELERETAQDLRLFGVLATDLLARAAATGPEALSANLQRLRAVADQQLAPGAGAQVFLVDGATGRALLGAAPPAGRIRPSAQSGLSLVLPAEPVSSAMVRWRATRYRVSVPAEGVAGGRSLVIEISTEPVIDAIQGRVVKLLAALLVLALVAVALARALSGRIVAPLLDLADAARALPAAIREHRPWTAPIPGLFAESVALGEAVSAMARSLGEGFSAVQRERDEQIRQRALLDLEAHCLAALVHGGDDVAGFARTLCRQVQDVLPGSLCLLLLPGARDRLEVAAAAGLSTHACRALERVLSAAAVADCLRRALATGAAPSLPTEPGAVDAALAALLRGGYWMPVQDGDGQQVGLMLTGVPATGAGAFAGEVMARAATLARVGLAALRLRRHHRVLLDALSQSGTGIAIAVRDGQDHLATYVNRGFEELTGYAAGDVLGRDLRMLRDGDDDQPDLDRLRRALATASDCRVTIRNRRPDGSIYWNALGLSPVHNDRGGVTHYIGVQQDLTETVEALKQLRASEARLREAQSIAHVGSWEWDIVSGNLTWSDETYRLLGYAPDAVPPSLERFFAVVYPDDRDKVQAAIDAALSSPDGAYRVEFRVRGPDGAERVLLAQGQVHFAADGTPTRLAGTILDVTNQRQVEDALRAERARYALVIEHLEDLLVRVDTEGRFEFVSPSYCRLFGRGEADLIGRVFMPLVHPDDQQSTNDAMARLFAPPHAATLEQRARTVHGWRWLQWSDKAVLDAQGKVIGIVGLGRDITERKEAERALREREQHFRALFETIGEGVIYFDTDGDITDANPVACALLGVPRERIRGRRVESEPWRLLREDGTPLPYAEYPNRTALRTGRDTDPLVVGLRAGTRVRWLLTRAHPETAPGATRPHLVFVTFADITSLLETRQRLQAILDSSPHGIVEMDIRERRLRWCNDAMVGLFGYPREALIGLRADELHPPGIEPELVADLGLADDDTDAGGLNLPMYVPCRHRDGRLFHCKIAPGVTQLGAVPTLTAFFTDVTLEYRGRKALEASRQALLKAQALAHIGSWEYDIGADDLIWSPEVYRIFEQDPAGFGASLAAFEAIVHPEDRETLRRAYVAAREEGAAYDLVHRLLLPDGRVKWVHERAEFERDDDGKAVLARGTVQDITERRLAELRVAEREAMLSELLTLAANFVDADDGDIAQITLQALTRIGTFVGADRAYLFEHDTPSGTITNTLEWTADGIAPAIDANRGLPLERLPALTSALARPEPLVIARVDDLAPDWAAEQALFRARAIQSLLVAPLFGAGELRGFVGFDAVRAARDWTDAEVHFLQVFTNILSSARDRAEALATLRITNARYEEVSRQSRAMAWEVDAGGRYTYVNSASLEVYGEPPEALLGRRCAELLAEDAAARRGDAERLLAGKEPIVDFVSPCRHTDGSTVWVLTNAMPVFDAMGHWRGYRGTDKDITERYLAQQQLKESRERLAAIFDNAPIGMALLDATGRLRMVNQALAELLGRDRAALQGCAADELVHPDDRTEERVHFNALINGREAQYRLTTRFLHPDGRIVWGDLRMTLLPTAPDAPPAPLAMVEDVTQLHLAQERRRELEETLAAYTARLEELLELVNQALPPEQQVVSLLRLGCRAQGLAAAKLWSVPNGREGHVLVAGVEEVPGVATPEPPASVQEAALAEPGRPVSACGKALGPAAAAAGLGCCIALAFSGDDAPEDGREQLLLTLWGRAGEVSLTDPLRQLLRLIAQRIAAVRTQARTQHNLAQARQRETIGHLASGVAHDFNNLLGVLDANLFYLEDTLAELSDDDPELLQVLEEIRSALGQAKVVTSGMLSLSRAGGVPLAAVDLGAAIAELTAILRHVLPESVTLDTVIPTGLMASSNTAFLQAALLNLALNARDAMPNGGRLSITVDRQHHVAAPVLAVGDLGPGDYVEVGVADTGSGMPAEIITAIFEPLFSTKTRCRGHGLGLFMVKEFVLRSGAGLAVESKPGRGSCFRLLLPPAVAAEHDADEIAAPGPALDGLRVLVVDDDPRVRDAVARLLGRERMTTVVAEDGQAALDRLRADPHFDLVLTDRTMPVLDGDALVRHLGVDHPGLPVLMMTGQASDPHGAGRPALRKPLDQAALLAAIRALCRPGATDAG
jgi:PAS domain S-box-containing protein